MRWACGHASSPSLEFIVPSRVSSHPLCASCQGHPVMSVAIVVSLSVNSSSPVAVIILHLRYLKDISVKNWLNKLILQCYVVIYTVSSCSKTDCSLVCWLLHDWAMVSKCVEKKSQYKVG